MEDNCRVKIINNIATQIKLPKGVFPKKGLPHAYCQTGEKYITFAVMGNCKKKVVDRLIEKITTYLREARKDNGLYNLYWRRKPLLERFIKKDKRYYSISARLLISNKPDLSEEEAREIFLNE